MEGFGVYLFPVWGSRLIPSGDLCTNVQLGFGLADRRETTELQIPDLWEQCRATMEGASDSQGELRLPAQIAQGATACQELF